MLNDLVDHSKSIKRNVNERQSCTSAEISEPRLSYQNKCDQNEIQVKTENVKNSGLQNNKKVGIYSVQFTYLYHYQILLYLLYMACTQLKVNCMYFST